MRFSSLLLPLYSQQDTDQRERQTALWCHWWALARQMTQMGWGRPRYMECNNSIFSNYHVMGLNLVYPLFMGVYQEKGTEEQPTQEDRVRSLSQLCRAF